MSEVVAGDLSRLTEDALAAAREFVALAALARQSDPSASNAVRVLSGCAADPEAFAWLWALVGERNERWPYVELPDVLAVPPRLESEVAQWVLSSPDPQRSTYGHHPSLAGFAGNVLVRLPDPMNIDLAKRAVSDDAGANSNHVRSIAMQVLGASRDPEGRGLVLRMIQELPAEGQARAFADLQPPHDSEEQAALVAAVQASRRIAIDGSAVPLVARVVGWLSAADIAEYLREAHPESRAQVLQPLVSALDLEVLKDLIGQDLGEDTAQLLLGHAANRAEAPELGSHAYSTLPPQWCAGFWQRYATWARSNTSFAPDRREQAMAALWDFTFATAEDDLAQPMSELLHESEVFATAQQVSADTDASRAQRLGAVAGHLLNSGAEQWTDEVIAAGDILPDIYWQGVSSTISEQTELSPKIVASAKQSPGALRAWAANGFSSQLQANVQSTSDALTLLEAAHEHLSDDNIAELFGIATWTSVSHTEYLRVVRLFDDRLPVLATQLTLAISSLQGREALAAPPNLIGDLLELSLAAGLRAEIEDPLAAVQLLLDQPDDEVIERTCAWIRALELDPNRPEVNHGIIAAVMAADDARSHPLPCLTRLRLDLGDSLAALALDQTQMTSRRIEHLQLGVRVLPTSARVTAEPVRVSCRPHVVLPTGLRAA